VLELDVVRAGLQPGLVELVRPLEVGEGLLRMCSPLELVQACGPVTLAVLDVSSSRRPHPAAKALYFAVRDLEAAFKRAQSLGCLSREEVHDAPGGGIVVRPWGERSFYAEDPWKNPLCFVEEGTVYTG
jgi:hypothetical protein